jgi:hypothetical protein
MRRLLFTLAVLAILAACVVGALAVFTSADQGHAQTGTPSPGTADPNQDILVSPTQGPWMICISSYTGPESAQLARLMTAELRGTYKLPAFVFNHGKEEQRKEDERVKQLLEQQRKFYVSMGVSPDTKLRVKRMHIEDQWAVLVGGYKDIETARRTLDNIKKMKPPDPKRVRLDAVAVCSMENPGTPGANNSPAATKEPKDYAAYINPFVQAFVVHNPTVPHETVKNDQGANDYKFLAKLNADEPFSLLKCPKSYTLVVKQYHGGTVVEPYHGSTKGQSNSTSGGFLSRLSLSGATGDALSASAMNAHNVAEALRKLKLDAYVLHTRYTSLVTIGGFDSLEDPRLRQTQQQLANLQLNPQLEFLPQAMPMAIPHP